MWACQFSGALNSLSSDSLSRFTSTVTNHRGSLKRTDTILGTTLYAAIIIGTSDKLRHKYYWHCVLKFTRLMLFILSKHKGAALLLCLWLTLYLNVQTVFLACAIFGRTSWIINTNIIQHRNHKHKFEGAIYINSADTLLAILFTVNSWMTDKKTWLSMWLALKTPQLQQVALWLLPKTVY